MNRHRHALAVAQVIALVAAGCTVGNRTTPPSRTPAASPTRQSLPSSATVTSSAPRSSASPVFEGLVGMPPPLAANDIYAADRRGAISPSIVHDRAYVYVPNTNSDDIYVIDQHTMRVVSVFAGGNEPQHVVPSYDLKTLYVTADKPGLGSLTPINPKTGKPSRPIRVDDAYNMYFTPNGAYAVVVQESYTRLAFYNPHTWVLHDSLTIPACAGIDHMDFTADGRRLLVSCEFANRLAVIDVASHRLVRTVDLHQVSGGMPQDVKLSPDGRIFYVADMMANGIYLIDSTSFQVLGFQRTGRGAHGLYISRDSRQMYVTNRDQGSISVINLATRKPVAKWFVAGGGSPDMGNVSADGTVLWLSGRYDNVVYAISTRDGHLIAKIPVGTGPHGLCVWPQPGRYSLGHTGIMR
ncbi:MAG: hypothetical protein QOE71_315 [Pseudonocardiales bacterium]|nr:hypothetical protein [Pseudonocardiales bacterium]